MKDLITFAEFEGFKLTFIVGSDGKRWFLATEVCAILGIRNIRQNVAKLREDEKGVCITYTLGGPQKAVIVSRPGLTKFLMRSRKLIAERFQDWLAHDVVESVADTGAYVTDRADPAQLRATADRIEAQRLEWRQKFGSEPKGTPELDTDGRIVYSQPLNELTKAEFIALCGGFRRR